MYTVAVVLHFLLIFIVWYFFESIYITIYSIIDQHLILVWSYYEKLKEYQVLGWAPVIKLKRGRKEYLSKGGQEHDVEIYRDRWAKLMETQKL